MRESRKNVGRTFGWLVLATVVLCVSVLIGSTPVWSQTSGAGTVAGQVTDQQGAAIVGAEVQLIDTATNTPRSATTNEAGRYTFTNVPSGTYNVTVSKTGFALAKVADQKVTVGLAVSVDVTLQVGSTSQTVEVQAGATAELQTMNATVGKTISGDALTSLPNLGRDATTLLTLQPAVHPNGSVAGAVRDQNTFMLDGGNNTNDMDGTMNTYTPSYASSSTGGVVGGTTTGVMPTPVESIEEFKVSTTNQTADFNGSAGAQVSMTTKRGGNQYHGSLYEYYFDSLLGGANTWLNGHTPQNGNTFTALPSTHRSTFGAAAGGPIAPAFWGGKWYIFADYQGFRFPQATNIEKTVPTALMRAGVIQVQNTGTGAAPVTVTVDGVPTVFGVNAWVPYNLNPTNVTVNGHTYAPANICSATGTAACDPRNIGLNPLINTLWSKYMPLPNDPRAGDQFNTQGYLTTIQLPQSSDFAVARIDHDFGSKWHFMGTWRYYNFIQLTSNQYDVGGLLPGATFGVATAEAPRPQKPSYYVAQVTTNITPNLTNNANFSYLRNWWQWASQAGQPQLPGLGGALEIGGETGGALIPYNVNTQSVRTRFWDGQDLTFRDDLSLLKGNHLLQFGGLYERNFDFHSRNDNGNGIDSSIVYQIAQGPGVAMSGTYRPKGLPSGQNNTWDNLYAEVLGIVDQPQVAYTRAGQQLNLQPLGTQAFDKDIIPTYNVYFSDSWRLKPSITLTYGLGYQVEMPPFEINGKQVSLVDQAGNLINTEDYLAQRKIAALAGSTYNPTLGFATVTNVGKGLKYPYNPFYKGFSPRVAVAWNPKFDNGILGHLVGNGQTVIRGGYNRIYGRLNGVDLVLVPLLGTGLIQAVTCVGAVNAANAVNGNQCLQNGGANPLTAFRIGTDGNSAPLPAVGATLPQPFFPGTVDPSTGKLTATAGDGEVLDPNFRPNHSDAFDLTIQRSVGTKMLFEVGYIGRRIRNEYQAHDLDAVPYMTTLGGQTYAQAYAAVYTALCGVNTPTCPSTPPGTVTAQPFFETALGGASSSYCTGFTSCTAAVVSKSGSLIKSTRAYDLWSALNNASSWTLGRTMPSLAGTCASQNPIPANCVSGQLTAIFMNDSLGYGNYNAVFGSWTARDWHGLTTVANFTYGRALGTGAVTQSTSAYSVTDPWDIHAMYGPQSYDIKGIANLALVYTPKLYKSGNTLMRMLLGGWTFSPLFTAQSGGPLVVGIQSGTNANCQSLGEMNCPSGSAQENAVLIGPYTAGSTARFDQVETGSIGLNTNPANGGSGINMFSNPDAVYNNFRRMVLGIDHSGGGAGVIRGLPTWNIDMSVSKQFKITERFGLELTALSTNILNHFQPGNPSVTLDTPSTFGRINSQSNSPRQTEIGVKFSF